MVTDKTIKKGYKQTELGIIPEDWDVKKMEDFTLSIASGKSNTTNELGDYPIYGSTGIIGYRKQQDYSGDKVLIARVGANAGTVNKVNGKYCVSDNTLMATYQSGIDINFSYYQLINFKLNKLIFGSGQPLITGSQIKKIAFSLPKKKSEQTAIATVLSDTDALIERLEKLIAKKKAIKQGAMQQLLTGKKRLPGFNGEWVVKKLGEIGEITGAGIDKKSKSDEVPIKLVNYLDVFHKDFIYSKDLNHWVTAPIKQAQRCSVKKGDVFFTPSSEMRYDIGISAVAMEDITDAGYSYHVDRLRLFDDWDLAFRTYIFKTKNFLDQAETICEGSGKRYVISLSKFREMTVGYPVDKLEQTAIAKILSDMDGEIESLEQRRDKYTMIKQGIMQQLLTGKIRII